MRTQRRERQSSGAKSRMRIRQQERGAKSQLKQAVTQSVNTYLGSTTLPGLLVTMNIYTALLQSTRY